MTASERKDVSALPNSAAVKFPELEIKLIETELNINSVKIRRLVADK